MPGLNKLTDYATVIMAYMAQTPARVCSARELAGECGIRAATTSKILKMLARHGLVRSQRGAGGGYLLARDPADISMVQIIEAMEGPLGMTDCGVAAGLCARESACVLRPGWQRANAVIRQALSTMSLAQMTLPMDEEIRHDNQPSL